MANRAAVVALVLAVLVAGCPQGGDSQFPDDGATATTTTTPQPPPRQTATPAEFTWGVSRVAGLDLRDGGVGTLAVVMASGADTDALDVANATVLLRHDGESYRFVHGSATGDADGTFTVGPPGPEATLVASRTERSRVLVFDIGPDATEPIPIARGERATLLVSTPDLTTRATELVVPDSLATDVSVQLSGEFASLEREPERRRAGRPVVVSAAPTHVTDAGATGLNLTVTKLPGTAPLDYRTLTVQYAGTGGFRTLTYSRDDESGGEHFAVTPLTDADGSAPVLNDGDRFRLTLDLAGADGSDDETAGQPLARGDVALVQLALDTRRTRFLRLRLPTDATNASAPLEGVVPKSDAVLATNERPTIRVVTSDAERVAGGSAIAGFEVDVFKPPTAPPIDPRTLTLTVETPSGTYTLVHASSNETADGHFGLQHRFDLDYSAPILDDDVDFARLDVALGENSTGDNATAIGDPVSAGSLVTVTATTDDGVSVSRGYLVTERDGD